MAFPRQLGLEPSGQIDQQTATALGLSIASTSGRSVAVFLAGPDIVKVRVNRAGCGPHREGEEPQCAGTFNAISAIADWQFAPKWDLYTGLMFSKVNGGLANG